MRNYGDTIPSTIPGLRNVTIKQPVGVVGVITPWNVSPRRRWDGQRCTDGRSKTVPFCYDHQEDRTGVSLVL
jgi:hypothetical protein